MSIILMTTVFYKAVILQWESWCWSLLGLKGLTLTATLLSLPRGEDEFNITLLSSFGKKIELIFLSLSLQVEMIEDHVQQKGMKPLLSWDNIKTNTVPHVKMKE